ncbi:MAG: hypothetical protein RBR68_11350 [Tenuifilaceae bacterium]|nr:hypothetical protein [Tenuifilaceae bacterium]
MNSAKVIQVIGPSFTGKTYLISRLIVDFNDFHIINFEKHFVRNSCKDGYMSFYRDILDKLKSNKNIICESVYGFSNNPFLKLDLKEYLTILCWPTLNNHKRYVEKYRANHSKKDVTYRLGSLHIEKIRLNYNCNFPSHIYDGINYNKIKKLVGDYVKS